MEYTPISCGNCVLNFPIGYEPERDFLSKIIDVLRLDAIQWIVDTPKRMAIEAAIRNTRPIKLYKHDVKPDMYHPTPKLREFIFRRDNRTCRYCGKRAKRMCIEHIVPFSRGGKTTPGNLVCACTSCNNTKRSRTPDECGMVVFPLELIAVPC